MAVITTAQDGRWDEASTWTGGSVPTFEDDARISHNVTLYNNNPSTEVTIPANRVDIREGGSLTVDRASNGPIRVAFNRLLLYASLDDTRVVNLDGVRFQGIRPSLSSVAVAYQSIGVYSPLAIVDEGDGEIVIDDTGFISTTAMLRDIKPEGCARAYAEKISNGVRYHTIIVHIKYTSLHYLRALYRMAENPFQALAVTPSCVIKGWIESVVPDASSVGKEYITVRVTVTEGA